jgi:hypothetical protein
MNQSQPLNVSVVEPLTPAFERVKEMLFSPFDIGRWFAIGFCAWLAFLGEGGGPSFSGNWDFGGGRGGGWSQAQNEFEGIRQYLPLIIAIAITVSVIIIAISILLLWLKCRGKFMFLHSVARNSTAVVAPWHEYKRQANSLFWFMLVFGILSFLILAVIAAFIALASWAIYSSTEEVVVTVIVAVLMTLVLFVPVAIVMSVIGKLTTDFVVPVMFLRRACWRPAWREFGRLLSANKARFLLYMLFQVALCIGLGAAVTAFACIACCLTCCIAWLLLSLPYIGTVILLPVSVFTRSYSLYYLAQYGPDYDVFVPVQPVYDIHEAGPAAV